jgi:hypothetical protein
MKALELELAGRLGVGRGLDGGLDLGVDQDLAVVGVGAQSGCEIDHGADRAIVERYPLLGPDFHRLDRSLRLAHFAVGTRITSRPPHRTVHAAFPHTASPTSGV